MNTTSVSAINTLLAMNSQAVFVTLSSFVSPSCCFFVTTLPKLGICSRHGFVVLRIFGCVPTMYDLVGLVLTGYCNKVLAFLAGVSLGFFFPLERNVLYRFFLFPKKKRKKKENS